MPPIIDMRNHPTWLHPFFGAAPGTPDYEVVRWLNRRVGSHDVDHFTRAPDLPAYLAEIEAAGIAHAFMVGRSTPTVRIAGQGHRPARRLRARSRQLRDSGVLMLALGVATRGRTLEAISG